LSCPEEAREFPILDGAYDDEDERYLPLMDEGFFDDDDIYE
jgi:hypothetical protein